jgi:hypothetical protein
MTMQNFQTGLLDHLLARVRSEPYSYDGNIYCDADYTLLTIKNNRIFVHNIFRINYTTYDGQRESNTVKPFLRFSGGEITSGNSDRCMIMLASAEDDKAVGHHPFWYAQVLGIFHCLVYERPNYHFKRINFLWIRWLGRETGFRSGTFARRLDKVGFLEGTSEDSSPFGFVDPEDVIRSSHLIPSFREGKVNDLLGRKSFVQQNSGDWSFYYVGR